MVAPPATYSNAMEKRLGFVPMKYIMDSVVFSEAERWRVQQNLWQLLGKQIRRYTGGDSTSVPVEIAEELLQSINFTLDVYFETTGMPQSQLLTKELDALLKEGQGILKGRLAEGKTLWEVTCQTVPAIENIAYEDTLRSIGQFFQRYDYYFLAHQIPCQIDYPLCHPVSEELEGIEYIHVYLQRMQLENGVLGLFVPEEVICLLECCYLDYRELLINLCEPVVMQAVGLALQDRFPLSVQLSQADCTALWELFMVLSEEELCVRLEKAAEHFCRIAGITGSWMKAYFKKTVQEAYPRILAALPTGELNSVFIPMV